LGAPSGGMVSNTAELEILATGGSFGSVVAVGIFDDETAGNLWAWRTVTAQEVTDGKRARFQVATLSMRIS
jgi:hypothetical protein